MGAMSRVPVQVNSFHGPVEGQLSVTVPVLLLAYSRLAAPPKKGTRGTQPRIRMLPDLRPGRWLA